MITDSQLHLWLSMALHWLLHFYGSQGNEGQCSWAPTEIWLVSQSGFKVLYPLGQSAAALCRMSVAASSSFQSGNFFLGFPVRVPRI